MGEKRQERQETIWFYSLPNFACELLAHQSYPLFKVIDVAKRCKCKGLGKLVTTVPGVFCCHIPYGLAETGSHTCHLCPSSLNQFSWLPSTSCSQYAHSYAAISCQTLYAWRPASSRWSIRNEEKSFEWKYLAWLPAGQILSFKLAFFIGRVSKLATNTDGLS